MWLGRGLNCFMPLLIPNQWRYAPPESLVVGDGAYAAVLASVFAAEVITLDNLRNGPQSNDDGGYPQVFENLARVYLVMAERMSAADALQCHEAAWDWVVKLAPARDQHELAFVFILTADDSKEFEEALAAGLGLAKIDPASTGHAVWRCSGSLTELLDVLANIQPMDLVPIRARRAADIKHTALARLCATVAVDDATAVREAACEVLAAFSGSEYLLDVFCRPPSHQHGNLLRGWLNAAVTEPVTQQGWMEKTEQLTAWLAPVLAGHTR